MPDKNQNNPAIHTNLYDLEHVNPNHLLSNEILQLLIELGKLQKPNKVIDLTCEYQLLLLSFQNKAEIIRGFSPYQSNLTSEVEQDSLISIKQGTALNENFAEKYDLVFCIPPLGERTIEGRREIPSQILYMEKALSILQEDGTLLFLCTDAFLAGRRYQEVRSIVMNNYNLKAIVTIPVTRRGITRRNLSILVIQNYRSKDWDKVLMPEYQNNRKDIIECFSDKSCELAVAKGRMTNRWDRNFFDPKYNKINDILQGKEVCKLEELGEIFRGHNFGSEERKSKGEYLLLRPRNVRNGENIQLNDHDKYIEQIESERKKKSILKTGDIVISLYAPRIIYVFKQNDPPCVASQMFAVIRSQDNEYIKTYLETKEGQDLFNLQADRKSTGTTLQTLNFNDLRKIRIPIIPIKNLNWISDKYIKENNNKEELEALKRELEIQKAINERLQNKNEHLIMSFIDNRFNAIEKKLNILIEKVDEVLDIVKGLESDVAFIKTLRTDEGQIIKFIEQKIDEAADNISSENLNTYVEIAKAWVDPNWFKLDLLSQVFLPNAELLYASISKMENGDPSTFIIQYCRALENELLNKIFKPYMRDLKERNIIVEEAFVQDLQLNENGNPKNRNRESYKFAKQLRDLQSKDESQWFFELGTMSLILIKLTGSRANNSPLFQDFKEFLLKFFDERFIDREYYEKIFSDVRVLRNKAAHPNIIDSSEGLKGREEIKSLLKYLLEMYK